MLDAPEAAGSQYRKEIFGRPRRDIKRQTELRGIRMDCPTCEPVPYLLKHCTGPATKFAASSDQTRVDTSISVGMMLMLFTDDGRPPRERSEMVPAVEMIVPLFVCST